MRTPAPAARPSHRRLACHLLAAAALAGLSCHADRPVPYSTNPEDDNVVTRQAAVVTPPGFADDVIFSGRDKPTFVRFSPDGRVYVGEKSGRLFVYDSLSDSTGTLVVDFRSRINSMHDRGLLGMALHPDFPATPHIFLLYSHDTATNAENGTSIANRNGTDSCPNPPGQNVNGCVSYGRLVRLTDTGSYPITSETVLITEWPQQFSGHSIGHLAFGPDGYLYATGGDGALHNTTDIGDKGIPVNPLNDPAGWGGALRVQSLRRPAGQNVTQNGALLRIDPATGAAAPGNPNASHPDPEAKRIIAYGFRTPFRFTIHPTTGEVWVADVGAKEYDEINRIQVGGPVRNYGWPCYEGTPRQPGYDSLDMSACENLYSASENATSEPEDHQPPYFTVRFGQKVYPADSCSTIGNTALSGLAFYQGGNYPAAYTNAFFFSDYSRSCIWVMSPGGSGLPDTSTVTTFATGATSAVDLQVGPGGDLFYVNHTGGTIHRIRYLAPNAEATANPTSGAAPLDVQFSGAGSTPVSSGDTLSYAWDLDDDGQFDDSTSINPSRVFNTQGTYQVRLRVTDQLGRQDISSPVTITVGSAPVAVIDTPTASKTFFVDEEISFSGHATDAEDGPLPPSALSWELFVEHCPLDCHTHSVLEWTGIAGGTFPAPEHEYPSYLRLVMRATDSSGLVTTVEREIHPLAVDLTFQAAPVTSPPLVLGFNFEQIATPFTRTVIVGSNNTLTAPGQSAGGVSYSFDSWSDGGAQSHVVVAGTSPATYTATFVGAPWQNQDVGAVDAAGSYSETGGTFTLQGSGADVWGTTDEMQMVYQTITGDATITARVTSLTNTNVWSKAGVMIRDGLAGDAANAFMLVSPTTGNLYRWQTRTSAGSSTTSTGAGSGTIPVWLRVVREGNTFQGFYSNDGVTFTQAGVTTTIAMGASVQVGLAVTSHSDGALATGVFDNVDIVTPVPPGPPNAPAGLTATAGDRQVALSWNTVSGASTYTVKRSPSAGGPFTSIQGGIAGTSFTDTNLDNGTTYHYVVSASNAAGESGNSNVVSATPAVPQRVEIYLEAEASTRTAPMTVGSDANASEGQYIVATGSGNSTGSPPADGRATWSFNAPVSGTYRIWGRTIAPDGARDSFWVRIDNGTWVKWNEIPLGATWAWDDVHNADASNAVVDFPLSAGNHTLEFAYRERNTWLDRVFITDDANAVPSDAPASPPGAPTSLTATAGVNQVSLDWSASSGASEYILKRSTQSGGPYSELQTLTGTSYLDTAVSAGTTYSYVVTARNGAGESGNSNQAQATPTAPPPPGAPSNLTATAGNAQVSLSWSASSGATSYTVKRGSSSSGPFAVVLSGLTSTGFTDTTVSNGTTYHYVVTATNSAGESGNSNVASATPVAPPPPAAPTGLSATAGNAVVSLSWTASSGASTYTVKRSTTPGGGYATVQTGISGTSFTDTGLVNFTTYTYVVTASNANGESGNSNEASATPAPPPPPAAPTGLVATAGDGQVALSWNASSGTTSYTVKRSTTSGTGHTAIASGLGGTGFTDSTAVNDTTYYYVVTASNAGGESPSSAEASATPTAPPAPAFLNQDVGSVGVAGSWSESGGSHTVLASGTDIWASADAFHFVHQQLTGDGTITARVASLTNPHAFAKAGVMMRESLTAGSRNLFALLTPTTENGFRYQSRTATNGTTGRTFVTPGTTPNWLRIVRTGNVFTGQYSTNGTDWNDIGASVSMALPATIYVGLAATSHDNTALATAVFDNVSVTTPAPPSPPSAPTGLAATSGDGQVALSWSPSSGASSYAVKRSTTSGTGYVLVQGGLTGTSFTNTGLTNGTTYYYVVTASNPSGESGNSAQASATPEAAPTWSTQDVGAVAATGSWSVSGGTHTIRGSGADIWGSSDEFRYVFQAVSGDMTITARVVSVQNVNVWTKAGLMVRDGLAGNARNIMVLATPTTSNAYRMQRRTSVGGSSGTQANTGPGTVPVWLRLRRQGNTFTSFYSLNGISWTQMGTMSLSLPSTVNVGMAVTSHSDGSLATATFDGVTLTTP